MYRLERNPTWLALFAIGPSVGHSSNAIFVFHVLYTSEQYRGHPAQTVGGPKKNTAPRAASDRPSESSNTSRFRSQFRRPFLQDLKASASAINVRPHAMPTAR
jgi:hypothetical protein